jgi:hypothetical protein
MVRFISSRVSNVRFTPKSRHRYGDRHVRFVPKADKGTATKNTVILSPGRRPPEAAVEMLAQVLLPFCD